jgi:predicted Rossmann fold flavoprotein
MINANEKKSEYFDVAVIGGGAAGMMAAISASQNGAKVALIEKNQSLGKKLLLTGNGRCNITQANYDTREFIEKVGKNGKFLFSSLSSFGPKETIEFFEHLGLTIKIEKDGRVFPASDKAQDVLDALIKALVKNKVMVMFNQNVIGIKIKAGKVECVETENKKIYANNFILSTGGKSYPATGSTGDGYSWLANSGHKINPPAPALTPVKIEEDWVKNLQGISLKSAGINLIQNKLKISLGPGEIVFTHFGLSGPDIINASKTIGEYLEKGEVSLGIDLFPTLNTTELEEKLKIDFEKYKKINLKNYLSKLFPQKLALATMKLSNIESDRKIHSLTKLERTNLAKITKDIPATVEALLDFNHAMITSGGVNLQEVDPKTMRSKIIGNLFLAGEILDLDGPTGGYNLQIAWTTGHAAGKHAKKLVDKCP